ncbi:hypothetical protein GGS24DRAFT_263953 [Hypoxylon argillaceum]|nr:hypothetical protein GGS24DRAFT_263953 [Hypoxylon argillaceum]
MREAPGSNPGRAHILSEGDIESVTPTVLHRIIICSISGLVVKSIVAIDGPRVRFTADAFFFLSNSILFRHVKFNFFMSW